MCADFPLAIDMQLLENINTELKYTDLFNAQILQVSMMPWNYFIVKDN